MLGKSLLTQSASSIGSALKRSLLAPLLTIDPVFCGVTLYGDGESIEQSSVVATELLNNIK